MSGNIPYEYIYLNNLSGGLNVSDNSLTIGDNEFVECKNAIVKSYGSISKRDGYLQDSAYTVSGASGFYWVFQYATSTGNIEILCASIEAGATKIYRYSTSTGFTEITGGTAFAPNEVRYKVYRDYVFIWDEASTFKCYTYGGSLQDVTFFVDTGYLTLNSSIKCLEICDNRIFFVFNDQPNTVYYSEYSAWVTNPTGSTAATDGIKVKNSSYFYIRERTNDLSGITAMKSFGNNDELLIFREYDTWVLLGVGATNYSLRKLRGELGCISQNGVAETERGEIFVAGAGKIGYLAGDEMISIADKIDSYITYDKLKNCHAEYDSSRNLVYFTTSNGTVVCNILSDIGEGTKLAWTWFDIQARHYSRFKFYPYIDEIYFSISGSNKLYTFVGNTDNGTNINFSLKTKTFDMSGFAESKFFRLFKSLHTCISTTPFTVTLHVDGDTNLRGPYTMTMPSGTVAWNSTTWNGNYWNGNDKLNGSLDMGADLRFFEISFRIVSSNAYPLTIHKLAIMSREMSDVKTKQFGQRS